MKAVYKGHEIDVRRERAMGGWTCIYYSIFRQSDRFECTSGFSGEDKTPVRQFMKLMRERVDAELAERNPWLEYTECYHCQGFTDAPDDKPRCTCLDDDESEIDFSALLAEMESEAAS